MRIAAFYVVCALCIGQRTPQPEFIPKGVLSVKDTQSYTKALRDAKEPSLYQKRNDPKVQEYRLKNEGSAWSYCPYILRLHVNEDGSGVLVYHEPYPVKRSKTGQFLYDKTQNPVRLDKAFHKTFNLNKAETDSLLRLINASDFWNLPANVSRWGHDGETWIIEGVKKNKYHLIRRWSPEDVSLKNALDGLKKFTDQKLGRSGFASSARVLRRRSE